MQRLYGEQFINMIKSFYPTAKIVSGRRQLVLRCKACGDSKDQKHAHLYVKVPQSPDELPLYQCKKCMTSGIVNEDFLRLYGCENTEYIAELSQQVKAVVSSPKYAAMKLTMGQKLKNSFVSNRTNNIKKLEYLNSRLGSNFTLADLGKLKIFLNLTDVLRENNLIPTMSEMDVMELDEHFIGFIGFDNTRAILRRWDNSASGNWMKELRYINYNFVPYQDAKTYYVIPSTVDLENPMPTQIHITEGVFDILSVFYNLNNCNTQQNVYISASGKSYLQALEFILTSIGLINYTVHFYPDLDISDREFGWLLRKIDTLPADVHIHRNLYPGEKDFGVPKNLIREGVMIKHEKAL